VAHADRRRSGDRGSVGDVRQLLKSFPGKLINGVVSTAFGSQPSQTVIALERRDACGVDEMKLWDNWRMLHCCTGVPPGMRRHMRRTTIPGDYGLRRVETKESARA
jgi:hypothetical protein